MRSMKERCGAGRWAIHRRQGWASPGRAAAALPVAPATPRCRCSARAAAGPPACLEVTSACAAQLRVRATPILLACALHLPQVVGVLDGVASPEDCCRACHASTANCTVRSCARPAASASVGPPSCSGRACSLLAHPLPLLPCRHRRQAGTHPCACLPLAHLLLPSPARCAAAGVELVQPGGSHQRQLLLPGIRPDTGGGAAPGLAVCVICQRRGAMHAPGRAARCTG